MIRRANRKFWQRRFAWLPIRLNNGPQTTLIWWEWVWVSNGGDCRYVSLTRPEGEA